MAANQISIGQVLLERFVITEIIEGGMASVVVVKDLKDQGKIKAIKLLPEDYFSDEDARKLFIEEGSILSWLDTIHIVHLSDIIENFSNTGIRHYLVMEYCDGGNLKNKISIRVLDTQLILTYAFTICVAMNDCQQVFPDLVHGDLKPENLLFGRNFLNLSDPTEFLKIADFGLAKRTRIGNHVDLEFDADGSNMGTTRYMSPEQLLSPFEIDTRSDIYSFGLILLEMFTGELPFSSLNHTIQLKQDPTYIYPVESFFRKDALSDKIIYLINKCLQHNKENRYQNWGEIINNMREVVYPSTLAKVFSQDESKVALTDRSLDYYWKLLWPDDLPGLGILKIDDPLLYASQLAEKLYNLSKEEDALRVIDFVTRLPYELDSAIERLKVIETLVPTILRKQSGDQQTDRIWNLLSLRTKCFLAILENYPQDNENMYKALKSAELLKTLYPNDAFGLCLYAQALVFNNKFDEANKVLMQAETLAPKSETVKNNKKLLIKIQILKLGIDVNDFDESIYVLQRMQEPRDAEIFSLVFSFLLTEGWISIIKNIVKEQFPETEQQTMQKKINWLSQIMHRKSVRSASDWNNTNEDLWKTHHGNNARTGKAQQVMLPLKLLWDFQVSGLIQSGPIVGEDRVFFGTESAETGDPAFYAIDTTTKQIVWKFSPGANILSAPTLHEDMIFFRADNNRLYALDAKNGDKVWEFLDHGVNWYGATNPLVFDDAVWFESDKLYLLDAKTGNKLWETKTDGENSGSSPAYNNNGIVYTGSYKTVMAYNVVNKAVIWSTALASKITSGPVVDDNFLYVGTMGWDLIALDIHSGEIVWEINLGYHPRFNRFNRAESYPAVKDNALFWGAPNGKVYGINKITQEGIWPSSFDTQAYIASSPIVSGNIVFVLASDGQFYALNAKNGNLVWKYKSAVEGKDLRSSPAVCGGNIYIGWDKLYVFGHRTSEISLDKNHLSIFSLPSDYYD